MKLLRTLMWSTLVVLLTSQVFAEDFPASSIVQIALDATGDHCNELIRDQACYGHVLLAAEPQPGIDVFNFDAEGDRVDVAQIQSLRLSGLDISDGTWGVAMLALRANLPSALNQQVTLLAFGDVAMSNAVPLPTSSEVRVLSSDYINVRLGPSTQAGVVGVLAPGTSVMALERLEDNSWLRVRLPDGDTTGWLFTDLVETDDSLETLNVAGRQSAFYEPMQAFYFSSAANAESFEEVPSSGLLIQTPEGVGEVQLLINEVNIQIGSTVYFQAQPNGFLTVATLEGHADVSAFGYEFTAFPGTQVTVPLDENLIPKAAPNPPVPYDEDAMRMLPIGILQRQIDVSPAMTYAEIQATQEIQETLQNGDSSANCCTATESEGDSACSGPGQSCNAPGLGGSCPGNSCNNPGQGSERNNSPGKGKGQGNN